MIHPHVLSKSICFGESGLLVQEYLSKFEFVSLVKLLYAWAFSYNESSCYFNIQKFYDRNKKQNEVKK